MRARVLYVFPNIIHRHVVPHPSTCQKLHPVSTLRMLTVDEAVLGSLQ